MMTDTVKSADAHDHARDAPHVHGPDCNHDHDHGHHHHPRIEQYVRATPKVGRKGRDRCGSGKKHKKCCIDA
jgi:uncharacterized protein YchJ